MELRNRGACLGLLGEVAVAVAKREGKASRGTIKKGVLVKRGA